MKYLLIVPCLAALLSIACAEQAPKEFITFRVNRNGRSSDRAHLKGLPIPAFEDIAEDDASQPAAGIIADLRANGSRIAYGNTASRGQFSYAAFVYGKNFQCSGSLISPRVVMTAAHCVYKNTWTTKAGDIRVMLGSPNYYDAKAFGVKVRTKT